MAVNLSPIWGAGAQLFDNSGNVLSGGKIYTYAAGTTTPATTYTSSSGITANSNPIILNSAGRVPYEIWLSDTLAYKFVLKDSNDTLIATYDNLVGINSNFIAYTAQQEIQTATAGQTVFNLTTMQYQPATNNLSVFVDGVNQYGPGAQYAYVETDTDTVTFVSGLHVGASVKFTTASPVASAVMNAENVAYDPPFTGAVGTNVEAKLAQTVSVKDFGAVGDGVTDDTAAFNDAIDSLGDEGGTIIIPNGMKCLLDTSLTIKHNISLKGPFTFVGSPQNNASYEYDKLSAIILNSAATITLQGNAGIDGCLIYRKGMVFPAIDGETSFAGTAITVQYDDAYVFNSMILGFEYAIYAVDCQRTRIERVNIDCKNGVYLENVFDVSYLTEVHCWPFTVVGLSPPSITHRSGSAIRIINADWPRVVNCFSYGYYRGLFFTDVQDGDVVAFAADGTATYSGSIGIALDSQCLRNKFTNCQTSSQQIGMYINTDTGEYYTTLVVNSRFSTNTQRAASVSGGNATFVACIFEASPYGVAINNSNIRVVVNDSSFVTSTAPFEFTATNNKCVFVNNNYNNFAQSIAGTNMVLKRVASASPLQISPEDSVIIVTGSTGFDKILYGWPGRLIILIFADTITLTNGTGPHSINIAGGTFSAVAGSTMTLVAGDTNWFETARKT